MIEGSCLCGAVRFGVERVVGPFELCHCSRCRKTSGSAFLPMVGVRTSEFHWLQGAEFVRVYEAPVVDRPPGYRSCFCGRCGSPVPDPEPAGAWFEIPAGALDGDPRRKPDRHIFVERKAPWFDIGDGLPQFDKPTLYAMRDAHPEDRS